MPTDGVYIRLPQEGMAILDQYCRNEATGRRDDVAQFLSRVLADYHARQTEPPAPVPADAYCLTQAHHYARLEPDAYYCATEAQHNGRVQRQRHLAWMNPPDAG